MVCPRILLVDDDDLYLESVREAIEWYGYAVMTASDAETAFKEIGHDHYDAYIFDLDLRGDGSREGIALVEAACDKEKDDDAAVLLVTAKPSETVFDRARELGADRCLEKPVSARRLVQILASLGVAGTKDGDGA